MSLRAAVLKLMDELRSTQEAGKHFDTTLALQALDGLVDFVIRALKKLSTYYTRSKIGGSHFDFNSK